MPSSSRYLQGFGIRQGTRLAGYELAHVEADHDTVKRYREYEYPTTLTWHRVDASENPNDLVSALANSLQYDQIIRTSYGNPYWCNFGTLEVADPGPEQVIIEAQGTCQRI